MLRKLGFWILFKLDAIVHKFGFTIERNYAYLGDVSYTGNLRTDLSTALSQFIGQIQECKSTDKTRSKIRLVLTKVLERHIIEGTLSDGSYYILADHQQLNPPESIAEHKLLVDVYGDDELYKFTVEGNTINAHP